MKRHHSESEHTAMLISNCSSASLKRYLSGDVLRDLEESSALIPNFGDSFRQLSC